MNKNLTILNNKGFTLIELVISIVLLGMLAAVGSTMISDGFTSTRMVNANQSNAGQARYAVERIAREIRETLYKDAFPTGYKIDNFTASNLVFTKCPKVEITCTPDNWVTVTINNNGKILTLGYSSPATISTLTDQVSSFDMSYYDATGVLTKIASDIRIVQISLSIADPSGEILSQRTRVALRNGA